MKTKICKAVLISSIILLGCKQVKESNQSEERKISQTDSLNFKLDSISQTKILPGFVVSIFNADSIYFQKGFGYSNLENKTPFKTENVQIIASVTKTLVGISLMQAVESNLLSLDDDINEILPYKVINPNFPNEKITLRMLASHTSSISQTKKSDKGYRFESPLVNSDFPEAYHSLADIYNKSDDISMEDFIQRKLEVNGEWYDKEIFINEKPGTHYEYSNIGVALLAHIIEIKTGKPFDELTRQLVLEPLEMNSSFWKLDDIPPSKHVTYYNELENKVPNYYIITYPDGGLYSSISDMTKYLQEMMKGYNGESQVLSKKSFREMMKKQFTGEDLNDGLCWDLSFDGLIGHSGNDFGTATLMYFSPENGMGRILFANISIETEEQEEAFYGIFNTLFEYDFKT